MGFMPEDRDVKLLRGTKRQRKRGRPRAWTKLRSKSRDGVMGLDQSVFSFGRGEKKSTLGPGKALASII